MAETSAGLSAETLIQRNHDLLVIALLFGRGATAMQRFLPPSRAAAAETKASHEALELVRKDPALSLLVIRLREAGQSWPDVKAAVEARLKAARTRNQRRGKML